MQRIVNFVRNGWWGAVVGLILSLPVAIHVNVFGIHVSNNLDVWAKTGDAMAGIYGPILSVLAFVILFYQYKLQQRTNKHTADQAYLNNARQDIEFYLTRLASVLDEPLTADKTVRAILHEHFMTVTVEDLASADKKHTARLLEGDVPQLQAMWSAFYSVMAGLSAAHEGEYMLQHVSGNQKAIAMVSFPTCVALEHYLYCRTEGRVRYTYEYSPVLSPTVAVQD